MITEELKALPKVELHCHLDGSLSHTFIEKRLGRKVSQSELSVSEDCRSLNEYLQKFDLPGKCLMDEAGLQEAGYDVLRSMKQENVCYAEIRFAPLLSETQDMNCNKVIEALLNGLERGKKDFGIEYGVITCAMRHHSEEENARMIRTARAYLGYGVCAADLAGAESLYPMSEFMELFKKTKALGMPFTLHAGECGSVQNILDSVEAGAGRIGHGIAMRGHADIQKELQKKGIGIEMCPISNLQTKAVESTKDYPMREFLNAGLKVTANTDNRTVSNTTLTKELEFIQKNYGITDEEIHLMMRNAVDVAFADDADFPVSTVQGHKGQFVFGYVKDVPVVLMQGRVHYYEGYPMQDVVLPTRLMGMMGAKKILLTNAAGGVNPSFRPGDFMLITDHITTAVPSPLIGPNIEELGTRFPDMSEVYSKNLQKIIRKSAKDCGIPLQEGVYVQLTGPNYETPAEIRMVRSWGADAVGMSTACEAMAARHMEMEVCGISCITNMAAGVSNAKLNHAEVQETADRVAKDFEKLVTDVIISI